jgi:site-specific DNA-methyltransferase (adenine-specific)
VATESPRWYCAGLLRHRSACQPARDRSRATALAERIREAVPGAFGPDQIEVIAEPVGVLYNELLTAQGDVVVDFFCHSGSALIAAELLERRCYTIDIDPLYCEITIRRLERLCQTGKTGWQNGNPFEDELRRECSD